MTLKSFNALSEKKLSDYKPYLLDVSARQCVGDYDPYWMDTSYNWHHVVPYVLKDQKIFMAEGALENIFDINDPRNCVALPTDCEDAYEIGASPHIGRHNNAYTKGMKDLLENWQSNFETGKMTQAQVQLRFGMMLRLVSAGLDPKLAELMPEKYSYQGDALLSQQDKRLNDPERSFFKEFLPDPNRPNCSVEQRDRYERAMSNSISIIELLDSEAMLVAQDKMKPIDFMREQEAGFIHNFLHGMIVRGPDVNKDVGVAIASVGALVALSATGAGMMAAPAAESTVGATVLPFVQRAGPLLKEGVEEGFKKVAGLVGLTVLASTPIPADASLISSREAADLLPAYHSMNAGTDQIGDRNDVNHICWRFTGLPVGGAGNTPQSLYLRDTDSARDGGALAHTAAHLLLRADGSIERSEQFGRPWAYNPQIKAGENGNAIGIYVEGTDSLTREQRMALVRTNEVFNVQRQSSTEQTSLTALLAASICEQNAWTEIQPSLTGSLTIRPILRSPSAGLAMGQ